MSEFFESELSEENIDNSPKGHPPIKFDNSAYICPERGVVVPHFDIGPEDHH